MFNESFITGIKTPEGIVTYYIKLKSLLIFVKNIVPNFKIKNNIIIY